MLYFIQAGDKIKIGRGIVPDRLRQAKTFCPDPPTLLLAITVPNEVAAETAMKRHFREFCTNGEWFRINFRTAFTALLNLGLIPDQEQPILELPKEEGVMPDMPPEFERWYVATRDREIWTDEAIEAELRDLPSVWKNCWQHYERSRREYHGDLAAMIEADRPLTFEENAEFFSNLRGLVQRNKEGRGR